MNDLRMELKVCEGCGVLWLRKGQDATVYCRSCAAKLAEFPAARGRRLPRATRRRHETGTVRHGLRVVGGRATGAAAQMVVEGTR